MCAFDVICSHWPVTCDSADRPERCFILEDGWQVLSPRLYFLRYHYQSVVPKEDPRVFPEPEYSGDGEIIISFQGGVHKTRIRMLCGTGLLTIARIT